MAGWRVDVYLFLNEKSAKQGTMGKQLSTGEELTSVISLSIVKKKLSPLIKATEAWMELEFGEL